MQLLNNKGINQLIYSFVKKNEGEDDKVWTTFGVHDELSARVLRHDRLPLLLVLDLPDSALLRLAIKSNGGQDH